MDESFWISIGEQVKSVHDKSHSAKLKLDNKQRMNMIKEEFESLLKIVRDKGMEHAVSYFSNRNETDRLLLQIQNNVTQMITSSLKEIKGIEFQLNPTGSYATKTNLLNESDIDFDLLVKYIDFDQTALIMDKLNNIGFEYSGTRSHKTPGIHIVMAKFMDGTGIKNVEIEIKIRSMGPYFEHYNSTNEYLTTKMRLEDKILITFIKHNLKQLANRKKDKDFYSVFKQLYYENANANTNYSNLLYSIE